MSNVTKNKPATSITSVGPFLTLFDEFKRKGGFTSDNAAAIAIGIDRRKISDYRKCRIHPSAYHCTRLAIASETDALDLIAAVEAEKGHSKKRGQFWMTLRSDLNKRMVKLAPAKPRRTSHG